MRISFQEALNNWRNNMGNPEFANSFFDNIEKLEKEKYPIELIGFLKTISDKSMLGVRLSPDGGYGKKITVNGHGVGWVMSSINGTWVYSLFKFKPEEKFESEEEAYKAALDVISKSLTVFYATIKPRSAQINPTNFVNGEERNEFRKK